MDKYDKNFIARVERHEITGDVSLHLIKPEQVVELSDGAEFVTLKLCVDPYEPA